MATKSEPIGERIVRLETEIKNTNKKVDEVCGIVSRVEEKLDKAIQDKADRTEVDTLQKQVTDLDKSMAILIVKVGFIVAIVLAVIDMAAKEFFKK
jgi:archaellum component FlaC